MRLGKSALAVSRVMGIDPATKTGCALAKAHRGGVRVEDYGEIYEKDVEGIERVQLIGRRVGQYIDLWKPRVVIIEGYAYGRLPSLHTLVALVEIGTSIRLEILKRKLPLVVCTPGRLKKFVTGKGNAKKESMMVSVFKQWNFEGTNNEVDAFGLAALGVYALVPGIEPRLGASQREVMQMVKAEYASIFC